MMSSKGLGAGIAVLMLVPQIAQADCSVPAAALAQMICPSDSLAAAWGTIQSKAADLAAQYPDLAVPLQADQALFADNLEQVMVTLVEELPASELPGLISLGLEDRLAFLERIDPARGTALVGHWQNANASFLITPTEQGASEVQLSASELIMGHHTCTLREEALPAAGLLTLQLPPLDEITFTPMGGNGLMGVDYTRAGRGASGPLSCSDSPAVDGWYFPVKERP